MNKKHKEQSFGMTLKQMARWEFFEALSAYRMALDTGRNIVRASIRIHQATSSVPRRMRSLVNRTYRETQTHFKNPENNT